MAKGAKAGSRFNLIKRTRGISSYPKKPTAKGRGRFPKPGGMVQSDADRQQRDENYIAAGHLEKV